MFGLPVDASVRGFEVDNLIFYMHILMIALFVGWGTFYIYLLVRFRKGKNPKADYKGVKSHASSYLELAVAGVELVLLVAFSIPIYSRVVEGPPKEDKAEVVHVIAQQFGWNFHYAGPDGKFGRRKTKLIGDMSADYTTTNEIGLDYSDPNAQDDIVTNKMLHVPVDKPVIAKVTSRDVIHSFGLPNFRVKIDAIPGIVLPTWFEARKTGSFNIACSQLCGANHANMVGYVVVESKNDYKEWYKKQIPFVKKMGK